MLSRNHLVLVDFWAAWCAPAEWRAGCRTAGQSVPGKSSGC
ncbi:MAG: hypothetical protein ACLRQY_00985 [[Clostridium] leptum]